ncbi:hypothetical protein BH11BAC1_BH11BAC1_13200 [soil metagenome]
MKFYFCAFICIFFQFGGLISMNGQGYSNLQNRSLKKVTASGSENFEKTNNSMPGQGLPDPRDIFKQEGTKSYSGKIDSVVVIIDKLLSVDLNVFYSDADNSILKVWCTDQKQKIQPEIGTQTFNIGSGGNFTEIKLKTTLSENQQITSSFLGLSLGDISNPGNTNQFFYSFPKTWSRQMNWENQKIVVSITPYSATARLSKIYENTSKDQVINKDDLDSLKDDTPEGPTSNSISIFNEIYSDFPFQNPSEISAIQLNNIFCDGNRKSGIFYYVPSSYSLSWSKEKGYDIRFIYGNDSEGKISVIASLKSGISSFDHELLKQLVVQYCKNNSILFKDLRALLPDKPKLDFTQSLSSVFNVPESAIGVSVTSSIFEPVKLSFQTDQNNANQLSTSLKEQLGVEGSLSFMLGSTNTQLSIPSTINFSSSATLGKIELKKSSWRSSGIRNDYPFPIRLRYLHVLSIKNDKGILTPYINTWKLGASVLNPTSQATFEAGAIPISLDNSPECYSMWISYSVERCDLCADLEIERIRKGTSADLTSKLVFRSMGVLDQTKSEIVKVIVQSNLFDPRNQSLITKELELREDNADGGVGPIYPTSSGQIVFKYKISLIGTEKIFDGKYWIEGREIGNYINLEKVEKSIGSKVN